MDRSGLQRIIPVIVVLIVIGIAIWALIALGRAMFSGEGDTGGNGVVPAPSGKTALLDTTADRSVRMVARGPIVAEENFHSYSMTITPDSRNMTTYVGYVGQTVNSEQLGNNVQAYTQFVNALSRANLMEGTPLTGEANNINGICATGYVYEFEVMQGTDSVQKLWTSTCKGSQGSLKANLTQVMSLFRAQIPNYSKLVDQIDL